MHSLCIAVTYMHMGPQSLAAKYALVTITAVTAWNACFGLLPSQVAAFTHSTRLTAHLTCKLEVDTLGITWGEIASHSPHIQFRQLCQPCQWYQV